MLWVVINVLLYFPFLGIAAAQVCNPYTERPCEDGKCIKKEAWCDGEYDCLDRSDERRCASSAEKIILNKLQTDLRNKTVTRAAEYILSLRNNDYGWKEFTSRAMVALAFAEKFFPIPEQEKMLMNKRLHVQILHFMRNGNKLNLIDLALYINALYATCQNPRNFHGMDLVEVLRLETEKELKSTEFNFPIVLMTLCIAGGTPHRSRYIEKLVLMCDDKFNGRPGFKAVALMAMAACDSYYSYTYAQNRKFIETFYSQNGYADIYSEILSYQALLAMGINVQHDLWTRQFADGSYGDLLATYYAIPVLMNTTLLNLKCSNFNDDDSLGMSISNNLNYPRKNVTYSLWISQGQDIDTHSILITFEGNKSLYDLMVVAKSRDPIYRFEYDTTPYGKIVYSLSGLPNDAETGLSWTLYHGVGPNLMKESEHRLREETHGIEQIFPTNDSHFIFWRKRKTEKF